jgi:hypothetical protein
LYTVWTPFCLKHHPSGRQELSLQTFPCVKKFRTVPACIRPDVSAARLDNTQFSTKLQDLFPKHSCWKIAATVRKTWIVQTRSSIRQVSQFKSRRPDARYHGPDARASDMEIACIRSAVRETILLVQTREASIWKLLAVDV